MIDKFPNQMASSQALRRMTCLGFGLLQVTQKCSMEKERSIAATGRARFDDGSYPASRLRQWRRAELCSWQTQPQHGVK